MPAWRTTARHGISCDKRRPCQSPQIQPGTVQGTKFPVTVPCAPTASTTVGSTCSVVTTANTVLPGSVQAGGRAIWELGQVQIYDGGADGDADTAADNTPYATQGIFVP